MALDTRNKFRCYYTVYPSQYRHIQGSNKIKVKMLLSYSGFFSKLALRQDVDTCFGEVKASC